MTPEKVWSGLIVLFLAGVLMGIGGTTLYFQREQERRWERGPAAKQERVMKLLRRELSLSSAQAADIEPIIGRTHVEILELRFSHHPEIEQTLAKGIVELKTKLSTKQQTQLDGLYAKLQQRWQVSRDYLAAAKKDMEQPE